jgi:predicted Holliday junction resolvase-like endonuclease
LDNHDWLVPLLIHVSDSCLLVAESGQLLPALLREFHPRNLVCSQHLAAAQRTDPRVQVIIFNTIIMAMDDVYASRTKDSIVQRISVFSDWAILAIFTVEMLLKMIGLGVGFRAPEDETLDSELAGYFASSWNRFDCFIVIISWILVPIAQVSGENVQNLVRVTRLARPLRALRDVRNLESVEMLLQTIPAALPAFMDVTNLLLFLLVVFSILTLNLWGLEGKMHGRCVVAKDRTDFAANLSTSGFLQQPAPVLCGKDGFNCDPGFVCSCVPEVLADGSIEKRPYKFTDPVRGDTGCLWQGTQRPWTQGLQQDEPICPDFGFTCWDSFPLAMFTHFKVITLEGWSQTMWWSQASMNPWVAIVILVVLVILVTFNVVNLYVASISNAYRDVRKRHRDFDNKRKLERVQRKAEIQNEKDRLKKQREDLIAIGEDVEEEEEEEKKDTLLDKIIAIHERLKVHRDATDPISPLSLTVRKFMVYPLIVDECGTLVDYTICRLLAERNLEVVFGPAAGNWSIFVKRGKKARRLGEVKTNFGGEMVKNGHTKNHEQRVELKAAVQASSWAVILTASENR